MKQRTSAGKRGWIGVRCALAVALVALGSASPSSADEPIDLALYATLLDRHTRAVEETVGTVVDYEGIARSAEWRRLVDGLAEADPAELPGREDELAFWINVYNILAIDLVARSYPVESIRDLGSFFRPVWKKTAGNVGGRNVTLDAVEHRILRPMGEPRIHAAIVCASTSCPSLRREPFVAARLEAQLDDAMATFLADPRKGARLDREAETIYLSKIFDWFDDDFTERGDVLGYVTPYLGADDRAWLARHPDVDVRHFDYDWTLNALGDGVR